MPVNQVEILNTIIKMEYDSIPEVKIDVEINKMSFYLK